MNKITFLLFSVLLACGGFACKKNDDASLANAKSSHAMASPKFPIETGVLRDGGTSQIKVRGEDGKDEFLFLVASEDPKLMGRMYKHADWDSPDAKPLSHAEALAEFSKLNEVIKGYYGVSDLSKIYKDAEILENEKDEAQIMRNLEDPICRAKLATLTVKELESEYRERFPEIGK